MEEIKELLEKMVSLKKAYENKIEDINKTIDEKEKAITWFEESIFIDPLKEKRKIISTKLEVINSVINDIHSLTHERIWQRKTSIRSLIVQTKKSHIEIEAEKLLNISSNQ